MTFASILVLAVGLAMDATAVAAACGFAAERIHLKHTVLVAGLFGGFQGVMPWLGGWAGSFFGAWLEAWGHWIAFAILSALGGKMLRDAWQSRSETVRSQVNASLTLRVLVGLAFATSVDAFLVGTTLPLLGAPMLLATGTIASVTAALSVLGLFAGRKLGATIGPRLGALGGLVLLGLGLKILLER